MDFSFSRRTEEAIFHARKEALRFKSADIAPEHLFLGIVKTDDRTRNLLLDLGINLNDLIGIISKNLQAQQSDTKGKDLVLSKSANKIMKIVSLEAYVLKQNLIEPYHVFLSILREPNSLIHLEFVRLGLLEVIRKEIEHRVQSGRLKTNNGLFGRWFWSKKTK